MSPLFWNQLGRCGFSRASINASTMRVRRQTELPRQRSAMKSISIAPNGTKPFRRRSPTRRESMNPTFAIRRAKSAPRSASPRLFIYKGRRKEIHERSSVKAKVRGAIAATLQWGVRAHPPIWRLRLATYEVRQVTSCLIKIVDRNLKSNSQPIPT